jgi:gliding motility-associated-like protein
MRSLILCGFLFCLLCSSYAQKPIISSVSNNSSVCDSTAITLSVDAISPNQLPVSFQWFRDGNPIANANTRTYTISLFTILQEGQYAVRVTNDSGSVISNNITLRLAKRPTINFDPSSVVRCESAINIFLATANTNLGGPLSYLWQKNNVSISSATTDSYTISNLTISDAGSYRVLITNQCGTSQSETKQLTVRELPVIVVQPVSTSICVGGSLQLTSSVTGADTYRWLRDGNVVNSNTSQFSINAVAVSDAGNYVLEASNTCGTRRSNTAAITVSQRPSVASVNQTFNGDRLCVNQPLTLSVSVNDNQSTITQYQWKKDGIAINGATGSTYQIARVSIADNGIYSVDVTNGCGTTQSSAQGKVTQVQVGAAPQLSLQNNLNSPIQLCEGGSATIGVDVIANNGGVPQLSWKQGGVLLPGLTSNTRVIASVSKTDKGVYVVEASNSCGTGLLSFGLIVKEKPVITVQPVIRQELCVGQPLELRVEATTNNTGSLSYQWYKGGQLINGATNAAYTVANLNTGNAGTYTVEVQNSCGFTVLSNVSQVVVGNIPTVVTGPINTAACLGTSARFSVLANTNDGGSLQYQWTYSGTAISGAINPEYIINSVTSAQAGNNTYSVEVRNRCGTSVPINPVSLFVRNKPIIITQPVGGIFCLGSQMQLTSVITDADVYRWLKDGAVVNGNTAQLTINAAAVSDGGSYIVEASNACGTSVSTTATVAVSQRPTVVSVNQTFSGDRLCRDQQLVLSVTINDNAPSITQYQWKKDGVVINGATNATYQIARVAINDNGIYSVDVTNSCGTTQSVAQGKTTQVQVGLAPQVSLQNNIASPIQLCEGNYAAIGVDVSANNGGAPQLSWKQNGVLLQGLMSNTRIIASVAKADKGTYLVEAKNSCGSGLLSFEIIVKEKPTITVQPVSRQELCVGQPLELRFEATTNNTGGLTYQWYKLGQAINGATNAVYTVGVTNTTHSGDYAVEVQNSCGYTIMSSAVTVVVGGVPTVSNAPISATGCVGTTVRFSVVASSNDGGALQYQWTYGGNPIAGATGSEYVINNLALAQAGNNTYAVIVRNRCGSSAITNPVSLIVNTRPIVTISANQTALCEQTGSVTFTAVTDGSPATIVWKRNNIQIAAYNNLTSVSINNPRVSDQGDYIAEVSNTCGLSSSNTVTFQVNTRPVITTEPQSVVACTGRQVVFDIGVSSSLSNLSFVWNTTATSVIQTQPNSPRLVLASVASGNAGNYSVIVRNACGADTSAIVQLSVDPILSNNVTLSTNRAIVCSGNGIQLTAQVSGGISSGLSYTWFENGASIQAPNMPTFSVSSLSSPRSYQVEVRSACGEVVRTAPVEVSVYGRPVFTASPSDRLACVGSSIQLSATFASSNTGVLNNPQVMWLYNGQQLTANTIVTNSSTTTYTINSIQDRNAGRYQVSVADGCGATTLSSIGNLSVLAPPQMLVQPVDQTVCVNRASGFVAKAINPFGSTEPITLQWVRGNSVPVTGETREQLQFNNTSLDQADFYTLRATNVCGTTTSNQARLIVQSAPRLSGASPRDTVLCATIDAEVRFEVNGSSQTGEVPQVRWFTSDGVIKVDNGNSILIGNLPNSATYEYRLSNSCDVFSGKVRVLSETKQPTIVSLQTRESVVCESGTLNLSVTTSAVDQSLSYVWKRGGGNGIILQSQGSNSINSPTYSTTGITIPQSDSYTVEVRSACSLAPVVRSINIVVNPTPRAAFDIVSSDNQCLTGNRFTYTNRSQTNGNAQSVLYTWDLGDGNASQNQNIVDYVYSAPGIKTVQLRAYTTAGCSNTTNRTVTVQGSPAISRQPVGGQVCEGSARTLEIQVENNGATSLTYQWFKDNQPLGGNSNLITYGIQSMTIANAGVYRVVIRNNQCTSEISSLPVTITYQETPKTSFSTVKARTTCLGNATYEFVNNTPDIQGTTYLWRVSDGTSSTSKNLNHTFNSAGTYSVSLTASVSGCSKEEVWDDTGDRKIKVATKPVIKTDLPTSVKVKKGDPATLELVVEAFNPDLSSNRSLQYLWYKNGTVFTQASSANPLRINAVSKLDEGAYSVQVSNTCGTVSSNVATLVMMDIPLITQEPEDRNVCVGGTLQLSARAVSNDDSNPQYEWYYQRTSADAPTVVSNTTGSILTLSNFAADQVGFYFAKVFNTIGNSLTRTVFVGDETLPIINNVVINQDITKVICASTSLDVQLSVSSKRNSIITYAWSLAGTTIANQVTSRLSIASIQPNQAGLYQVALTNLCGTVNKNIGTVYIKTSPVITSYPVGDSICIGRPVVFNPSIQAQADNAAVTYQWYKNGLVYNASGQQDGLRLEMPSVRDNDAGIYSLQATNNCGTTIGTAIPLVVLSKPSIVRTPIVSRAVCVGSGLSLTPQINSVDPLLTYRWYKNGQFDWRNTQLQLSLQNVNQADSGLYSIEVANRCGLSDQYPFVSVSIIDKPFLRVPVVDQAVCEGAVVSRNIFNDVAYTATTPTEYLWKFNNQFLPNQTNSTLVLSSVSSLNQGRYGVLVRNSCGVQEMDIFRLNVINKPEILNQPSGAVICEKSPHEFSVQARSSGLSLITYQWYRDNTPVNGVSTPSYRIPVTDQALHDGVYYVAVTNSCGTTTSSIARLAVRPAPKMLINPLTPITQCLQGNNVRFTANNLSATVLPINTMWDLGDGTFQNSLDANHAYKYANDFNVRLVSTSQFGCKDTATAIVSINDQPIIIEQPKDNIVCLGGQAAFNVNIKTRSNEVISYQWYFQDRLINGVSNNLFTINSALKNAEGSYKVRIQNACNTVFSNEVKLQIAEKPLIITPFEEEKVCLDFRYVLKPDIYSLLPLTYTWYKNGAPLPTGLRDLDSVLINRFQISDAASYKLSVSNRCGVTESFDKKLVAKDKPQVIHPVLIDTICFNTPVQLKLNNPIVSADSVRYEWYKDAFELKEYGRTYQITSFKEANSGAYLVRLANQCGSTSIPVANLTLNRPKADFSADTVDACRGQLRVTVNGRASGFFAVDQYRWDIDGNRNILQNVSNGSHHFTQPGRVLIRYSYIDAKGCASDTVDKRFTNYGAPVPKFGVRDTCFNSPIQLLNQTGFGFGSSKFLRTIWDLGDTTIIRNNDTLDLAYIYKRAGLKAIKLTSFTDSSCVPGIITKDVMIFGNPTAVIAVQDSCKGFPVYFTSRSRSVYSPDSIGKYIWSFDDGKTSIARDPIHIFQQYGGHKIQLRVFSSRCPTFFHDTSMLLSIKIPRPDSVYSIVRAIKNASTGLSAINNGRSYLWSPGLGLNNVRIQKPWFRGQEGKFIYTITITDSAGCINKDTQEVWAFPEPNIYLASAFSPNGDNINETYKPEYIGIQYIEYFKVHDKNNRLIYSTNSMQESWDGKYQGSALAADAFIVSVSGIDMSGKRIQRQQVIVLVK